MNTQAIVGQKYVVTIGSWFNEGEIITCSSIIGSKSGRFYNGDGKSLYVDYADIKPYVIEEYKTPCQERGMEVGQKFKVIGNRLGWFDIGGIVTLIKDDGTKLPQFRGPIKGIAGKEVVGYVDITEVVAYVETTLTPMQLAGHKIGDKFIIMNNDGAGRLSEVITFVKDDGTNIPEFTSDKSGNVFYKSIMNIAPYVAPQAVTADISALSIPQQQAVLDIIAAFKETK